MKELAFAVVFFGYISYGPIRYLYRVYRARKRLFTRAKPGSE